MPTPPLKRCLISVSDKTVLVATARRIKALGFEIIATGGTLQSLRGSGIPASSVEEITTAPECFGGRVKTLHPLLFGGILYKRDDAEHVREAEQLGIGPIDLVIVNLYPFPETMAALRAKEGMRRDLRHETRLPTEAQRAKVGDMSNDVSPVSSLQSQISSEVIEQIDIGGPSLLRAAAKNFRNVTVVCSPDDYERVLQELETKGSASDALRRELAAKVFLLTAAYDAQIAEFLSHGQHTGVMLTNGKQLRYGENPHQWGKFYEIFEASSTGGDHSATSSSQWRLLQGKELSYSNILDSDAAWRMACEFSHPTAVFVKHANPSGIASHESIDQAFQRAYDTDRLSAFGVIIALNRTCTETIGRKIVNQKIFTEVLLAPGFESSALTILKTKPNLRVIDMPSTSYQPLVRPSHPGGQATSYRSAMGGMLIQNDDLKVLTAGDWKIVTKRAPTPEQSADLLFAWKVVKHTKSNAIVFAKDTVTLGIGSGQTNRVDATWLAAQRAGEKAKGAVMASDAFFPFHDSVEEAAKHGIAATIQPGGSMRDEEVIAKANELGIAMVTTGVRAFRH